jgi:hypothetical protein
MMMVLVLGDHARSDSARQVRFGIKKVRFMVKKLQAISSKEQHFWLAA